MQVAVEFRRFLRSQSTFAGAFSQRVHGCCVVGVKVDQEQIFRHIAAHASISGLHEAPQNGRFGIGGDDYGTEHSARFRRSLNWIGSGCPDSGVHESGRMRTPLTLLHFQAVAKTPWQLQRYQR